MHQSFQSSGRTGGPGCIAVVWPRIVMVTFFLFIVDAKPQVSDDVARWMTVRIEQGHLLLLSRRYVGSTQKNISRIEAAEQRPVATSDNSSGGSAGWSALVLVIHLVKLSSGVSFLSSMAAVFFGTSASPFAVPSKASSLPACSLIVLWS